LKAINAILMGGREVLPLIEGGKGISVSNGQSTGAWAAAGGVGTFSGVNADSFDENGNLIPIIYRGKTRRERHQELVQFAITGALDQARIAFEPAGMSFGKWAAVRKFSMGCSSAPRGLSQG
jgi:nitronate monooxygenase